MIYLQDKDPTEYNGWEQDVANLIQNEDTKFFPIDRAIVLKALQEQEAAEETAKEARDEQIAFESSQTARLVESMSERLNPGKGDAERIERLEAKVDKLAAQVETL